MVGDNDVQPASIRELQAKHRVRQTKVAKTKTVRKEAEEKAEVEEAVKRIMRNSLAVVEGVILTGSERILYTEYRILVRKAIDLEGYRFHC